MRVMFGESSMNSGASLTTPILLASLPQSASLIVPERMWCRGTCASADSRRMTISLRLISREKMTLARPCLMDAARAMSTPSVELCVGTIERPARYMCDAFPTSMQRTGTLGTGVTSMTKRLIRRAFDWCRVRSLWAICLRCRRNTMSCVLKLRSYTVDESTVRPRTGFVATEQR